MEQNAADLGSYGSGWSARRCRLLLSPMLPSPLSRRPL